MSDVRIERVEPCEHGNTGTHTMCHHAESFHRHDNCPDPILCPRGSRKVLDGFPPEAAAAMKKVVLENRFEDVSSEDIADMALAAAWDALLRSDSE